MLIRTTESPVACWDGDAHMLTNIFLGGIFFLYCTPPPFENITESNSGFPRLEVEHAVRFLAFFSSFYNEKTVTILHLLSFFLIKLLRLSTLIKLL